MQFVYIVDVANQSMFSSFNSHHLPTHNITTIILVVRFGKNSDGEAVSACYQTIGPGHQAGP